MHTRGFSFIYAKSNGSRIGNKNKKNCVSFCIPLSLHYLCSHKSEVAAAAIVPLRMVCRVLCMQIKNSKEKDVHSSQLFPHYRPHADFLRGAVYHTVCSHAFRQVAHSAPDRHDIGRCARGAAWFGLAAA